jgi:CheY-like chemotaxis protein
MNMPVFEGRAVDILLVEDNPGDALLTQEALELGKIKNRLYCVQDGEEAILFLRKQPPYENVVTRNL